MTAARKAQARFADWRCAVTADMTVDSPVRRLPPVLVSIEPGRWHGLDIVSRCGRERRRHIAIALRSVAEREADELARKRGWIRAGAS